MHLLAARREAGTGADRALRGAPRRGGADPRLPPPTALPAAVAARGGSFRGPQGPEEETQKADRPESAIASTHRDTGTERHKRAHTHTQRYTHPHPSSCRSCTARPHAPPKINPYLSLISIAVSIIALFAVLFFYNNAIILASAILTRT